MHFRVESAASNGAKKLAEEKRIADHANDPNKALTLTVEDSSLSKSENKKLTKQQAQDDVTGQTDLLSQPAIESIKINPDIIQLSSIPKDLEIDGIGNAYKAMMAANQKVERMQSLRSCLG